MINGFEEMKVNCACVMCQYYYYYDKKCHNNKGTCIWIDITNTIKALEIIKKKKVDLDDLYDAIGEDDYHQNNEHNAIDIYNQNRFEYKQLTQDEWDLLKEVLL